jgi:hypothetical protein
MTPTGCDEGHEPVRRWPTTANGGRGSERYVRWADQHRVGGRGPLPHLVGDFTDARYVPARTLITSHNLVDLTRNVK